MIDWHNGMRNTDPLLYRNAAGPQTQWARELISKLRLNGKERILDVGCGEGTISAALAEMVPEGEVVGIDVSERMIACAAESFPGDVHTNLRFGVMDASRISYQEEFDVVFSNAALHWIVDHRPVVWGICSALKPGGRMLVQMGGKGNASSVIETLHELIQDPTWARFFQGFMFPYGFYGTEEYEQLLRDAGLKPVRIDLFERIMERSKEDFRNWLLTTWTPYLERVEPLELQTRFVDEIVEEYMVRFPVDAAGMLRTSMMRIEVEALK